VAIYSVSVKAHSRSKGESATGGAAYRLGIDLTNELTGERHNYSNREDVACAFTLLPENAPEGWNDPAKLWNEAEKAEKRINSCVSREVLVALPAEMTNEQREELTRSIAGELVQRYGVGLSCGIHEPDKGEQNYHAHILMTTRRLGPDGLGEKTRELDDKKQGPEQVAAIREMVANRTNEHLQRHGYEARVDHRSLEDQKQSALDNGDLEKAAELSRAPTQHRGRNPEVAQRVSVENENTKQANQQSQAEARAIFASMEQAAVEQGRLMAPASDTPKSQEAMEAEAKEQQQKERDEAFSEARKVWEQSEAKRQGKEREAMEKELRRAEVATEPWKQAEEVREKLGEKFDTLKKAGELVEVQVSNAKEDAKDAVRASNKWEKDNPLKAWVFGVPSALSEERETTRVAYLAYAEALEKHEVAEKSLDVKLKTATKEQDEAAELYKPELEKLEQVQAKIEAMKLSHADINKPRTNEEFLAWMKEQQEANKALAKQAALQAQVEEGPIMQIPDPNQPRQRSQVEEQEQTRSRGRDYGMSMGM
jgi:flagellar biosynthesis regulator FlaF